MNTVYVHTLGDSTLDNLYWMLNNGEENDFIQGVEDCVEGQLQKGLNTELNFAYQVISHAYDGFTTSSVLNGDYAGRVLNIYPGCRITRVKEAYLKSKNISSTSSSFFVKPLTDLKNKVVENAEHIHYVVISVGGNDFRERLLNPLAMLKEIPLVQERYLDILKEIKGLKDKNVKPILMFQYRLDAHHDNYRIYLILKVVGLIIATFNSLNVMAIGMTIASVLANKISVYVGCVFVLINAAFLGLSHQFIPLKVTGNFLFGKQEISMAALGGLLETFYRPILKQAQLDHIPILDLSNSFDPNDSDLYIFQIEPSKKGGELIAEGINHIINHHDFNFQSRIYSKHFSDVTFTSTQNEGPDHWSVAYPG